MGIQLVILNGCSCLGRVVSALVAHKTRVDYMAVGSATVCGAVIFLFIGIGSAVSVVLEGVIYGFAFGIRMCFRKQIDRVAND